MKKLTILTIIFILSQIFAANICLANAQDNSTFLSGCAWTDYNDNNVQELDEGKMADVIIFVENVETGKLITTKTNASGFFTITDLSYGFYNVWSENLEGVATPSQTIELNEVNGSTVLDFVFTPEVPATNSFAIFLPIILN